MSTDPDKGASVSILTPRIVDVPLDRLEILNFSNGEIDDQLTARLSYRKRRASVPRMTRQ